MTSLNISDKGREFLKQNNLKGDNKMTINKAKTELYSIINHFPQVLGCGIVGELKKKEYIKVFLREKMPFITIYQGFKVKTEVIKSVSALEEINDTQYKGFELDKKGGKK